MMLMRSGLLAAMAPYLHLQSPILVEIDAF